MCSAAACSAAYYIIGPPLKCRCTSASLQEAMRFLLLQAIAGRHAGDAQAAASSSSRAGAPHG